jgi:hypothetical protein
MNHFLRPATGDEGLRYGVQSMELPSTPCYAGRAA